MFLTFFFIDGYVDGYSLYAGYFGSHFGVDPSGLENIISKPIIIPGDSTDINEAKRQSWNYKKEEVQHTGEVEVNGRMAKIEAAVDNSGNVESGTVSTPKSGGIRITAKGRCAACCWIQFAYGEIKMKTGEKEANLKGNVGTRYKLNEWHLDALSKKSACYGHGPAGGAGVTFRSKWEASLIDRPNSYFYVFEFDSRWMKQRGIVDSAVSSKKYESYLVCKEKKSGRSTVKYVVTWSTTQTYTNYGVADYINMKKRTYGPLTNSVDNANSHPISDFRNAEQKALVNLGE